VTSLFNKLTVHFALPFIILIVMMLVSASSGVGEGVKADLQNYFDLLKIWVKMAPNVVRLQKMAPNVAKKHMTFFWRSYQKKVFMMFVGENL